MKLAIIIPAYDEEDSIGSIIERTISASNEIIEKTVIKEVEIIVVNDGSTDKTAEIVSSYNAVHLINFEKNRGYGAAIKCGFAASKADFVSFLDADGTCNPLFFIELVNLIVNENADVVLGNRMTKTSQMPKVRKLGNRIFALLLRIWAKQKISDTASGMRVIRKNSLSKLYPLPNGLHFTPAMSARAIFDKNLKILELPMPEYKERIGKSKLSVMEDGIRFLRVIVETAISYRPRRLLSAIGLILLTLSFLYSIEPIIYYLRFQRIEDVMIYRMMTIVIGFVTGIHLIATGMLSQLIFDAINHTKSSSKGILWVIEFLFVRHGILLGLLSIIAALVLNKSGILEYLTKGTVSIHWIYIFCGGGLIVLGSILIATGVLGFATKVAKERIELIENIKAENEDY